MRLGGLRISRGGEQTPAEAPTPDAILKSARALASRLKELRDEGRKLEAECDAERMQLLAQRLASLAESGEEGSAEATRLASTLDSLFVADDAPELLSRCSIAASIEAALAGQVSKYTYSNQRGAGKQVYLLNAGQVSK